MSGFVSGCALGWVVYGDWFGALCLMVGVGIRGFMAWVVVAQV